MVNVVESGYRGVILVELQEYVFQTISKAYNATG